MKAAKLFLHAMIFTHFSAELAGHKLIKQLCYHYEQALMDHKANRYHHCLIVQKHNLFSFENCRNFSDACLIFKVLHGLAPPPLCQFIKRKDNRVTRATTRGDCILQYRKSQTGLTAFSIRATN